ncbi:MerR family transcriptional regulator [Rhodobacteraceae bacterium 2CG4]|uniref:MerR family transcriptional regulator n=1 Tax=Halovulum marinum TaxID=2662447 RepID=A0A6L5Z3W9_9RHOB|nr:helix-turn-helix domain-containing protein [Halovulum marinum]MSU91263.1 MerR family transcriptional regulator [Halovulum marinum]
MIDAKQAYTLAALSALSGVPQRTVRYYIQQGLVDRPEGEKRGAYYTSAHLERLLEIRKWQRAGLSLDRIRDLVGEAEADDVPPPKRRRPGDVTLRSYILVAPGVEIAIEPAAAGLTPDDIRTLARDAAELVRRFQDRRSQESADETNDDGGSGNEG